MAWSYNYTPKKIVKKRFDVESNIRYFVE